MAPSGPLRPVARDRRVRLVTGAASLIGQVVVADGGLTRRS